MPSLPAGLAAGVRDLNHPPAARQWSFLSLPVLCRDGKRAAFEIETGKSDAAANVRKCLAAGMDKVVVVATSATVRDRLRSKAGLPPAVEVLTGAELVAEVIPAPRAQSSQRSSTQKALPP